MAGAIIIRPIGEDERAEWNPLWDGYLAFYKTALTPVSYTHLTLPTILRV